MRGAWGCQGRRVCEGRHGRHAVVVAGRYRRRGRDLRRRPEREIGLESVFRAWNRPKVVWRCSCWLLRKPKENKRETLRLYAPQACAVISRPNRSSGLHGIGSCWSTRVPCWRRLTLCPLRALHPASNQCRIQLGGKWKAPSEDTNLVVSENRRAQ